MVWLDTGGLKWSNVFVGDYLKTGLFVYRVTVSDRVGVYGIPVLVLSRKGKWIPVDNGRFTHLLQSGKWSKCHVEDVMASSRVCSTRDS